MINLSECNLPNDFVEYLEETMIETVSYESGGTCVGTGSLISHHLEENLNLGFRIEMTTYKRREWEDEDWERGYHVGVVAEIDFIITYSFSGEDDLVIYSTNVPLEEAMLYYFHDDEEGHDDSELFLDKNLPLLESDYSTICRVFQKFDKKSIELALEKEQRLRERLTSLDRQIQELTQQLSKFRNERDDIIISRENLWQQFIEKRLL